MDYSPVMMNQSSWSPATQLQEFFHLFSWLCLGNQSVQRIESQIQPMPTRIVLKKQLAMLCRKEKEREREIQLVNQLR